MLRYALTHIIESREKHRTGALCVKNAMRKTGKMQETYSEKEKYETNIIKKNKSILKYGSFCALQWLDKHNCRGQCRIYPISVPKNK